MRACIILALALVLAPVWAAPRSAPDRDCPAGGVLGITGDGAPPGAALLITWDGRPVGGGVASGGGAYHLHLAVGAERPGAHEVQVVDRADRVALLRFRCLIAGGPAPSPVASPSATPRAPTPPPPTRIPRRPVSDFDRPPGDGVIRCDDFDTQPAAQEAYAAGYTDLDGNDQDGLACESLPDS